MVGKHLKIGNNMKKDTVGKIEQLTSGTSETILDIHDQNGKLLLTCAVGDKYHKLLLEVGLDTILKQALQGAK